MAESRHRQVLGRRGEEEALAFLCSHNYVVIAKNYRSPYGEVDLIVRDQNNRNTLVFVEVRTHADPRFGDPLESVNVRKQQQVAKTAVYYLIRNGLENSEARFDVIGIRWEDGQARISHVKDAFELSGSR